MLAWHHDLCRRVARLLHRAVERHLRGWARNQGLADPRGGGVAVIQRFGGSVNLHVHVHALVLDGVFARTTAGALRFHAAPMPSVADMADILTAIVPAVRRLLARHGLDAEEGTAADPFAEATPLLAGWAAASVRGLAASGVSTQHPHRSARGASPTGRRRCRARGMRAGRASIYTRASACRPGIGTAWSASVATRCDPRWPTSACTARPAGAEFETGMHARSATRIKG